MGASHYAIMPVLVANLRPASVDDVEFSISEENNEKPSLIIPPVLQMKYFLGPTNCSAMCP